MTPEVRRAAEQDSARVVTAFFTFLDEREYERQWDQMTADGIWDRSGSQLDSREKFLAAMERRPEHLTIRHMISNLLVTVGEDGTSATAHFNIMVYRFLADRGDQPAPIGGAAAISAFTARMAPTPVGWRISHLAYEVLFSG